MAPSQKKVTLSDSKWATRQSEEDEWNGMHEMIMLSSGPHRPVPARLEKWADTSQPFRLPSICPNLSIVDTRFATRTGRLRAVILIVMMTTHCRIQSKPST